MRRLGLFVLLLALVPTLGCASRLARPGAGGVQWRVFEAGAVRLYTDLPEGEGRELVLDFHRRYEAIVRMPFRCSSVARRPPRADVVLFNDPAHYEQVLGDRSTGMFLQRVRSVGLVADPVLVVKGGGGRRGNRTVARRVATTFQHELVHRVTLHCFPTMPPWLAEGLAKVFESVDFPGDLVRYGRPPSGSRLTLPGVGELRRADAREFYGGGVRDAWRRYEGAWALVHMLAFGDDRFDEPFRSYLVALARGAVGEEEAWREHFGSYDIESLHRDYARRTSVATYAVPFEYASPPVDVRVLDASETAMLWARASSWWTDAQRAQARRWLDGATTDESATAAVLLTRADLALADGDEDAARRFARSAHRNFPDDEAAQVARVGAACREAVDTGELDGVARRLLARPARSVAGDLALACYFGEAGEHGRAQQLALRALARRPSCWQCHAVFGALLEATKRWQRAARSYGRAAALVPHGYESLREFYLSARDEATRRSTDTAPTPPQEPSPTSSPRSQGRAGPAPQAR